MTGIAAVNRKFAGSWE